MEPENRARLMSLTLDEKITYSKDQIKKALNSYSEKELYIAWTGGKDSTTMLWLCQEVCKELGRQIPGAIFIDEGDVFDEIWDFVKSVEKKWAIDINIVKNTDVISKIKNLGDVVYVKNLDERNRQELIQIGFEEDSFPFEPESFVGNHLMKTVALNKFLESHNVKALATAIRWDEQEARNLEDFFSPRDTPSHTRIHPILHFKERDIWDTIQKFSLPFCSLYYQGYRSLGARVSTVKSSDLPAWEQDLEHTTERAGRGQDKEAVMDQLRSLGYM